MSGTSTLVIRKHVEGIAIAIRWETVALKLAREVEALEAENAKVTHDDACALVQDPSGGAACDCVEVGRALRAENAKLLAALRGLDLENALTFEGRLEAHAYFSVDALNAALDVLKGLPR